MDSEAEFVDHYDVLQVSKTCDAKTLEAAYRRLAKQYHPDHSDSADSTKFSQVVAAYKALRNAKERAKYDALHAQKVSPKTAFRMDPGAGDENEALSDADDHARILLYLYRKRREDALNPGVVGYYLQEMLNCADDRFDFHKWYLREKGFIETTHDGTIAITIQGVDQVISMSRQAKAEKLLIAQEKPDIDARES